MKKFTGSSAALIYLSILAMAADIAPSDSRRIFKPDSEGFIQNWLVLDPISLSGIQHTEEGVKKIVAKEYFPDQLAVLPKNGDQVNVSGTVCQWREVSAKDYLVNLAGFASEYGKPTTNVLFWGVANIDVAEELKEVRLAIGSDDDSVWWVNGKQVIAAYGVRQTSIDDNVSKRLTLHKGINVIRFAVVQGDGPSDCCARFYDARQNVITGFAIRLDLPEKSSLPEAQ